MPKSRLTSPLANIPSHPACATARKDAFILAMNLSPTGTQQDGFHHAYAEMLKDKLSDTAIIVRLLNLINDGLVHGNWPTGPYEARLQGEPT